MSPLRAICLATSLWLLTPSVGWAQLPTDPPAVEEMLSGLRGADRIEALAFLTDAYHSSDPSRAERFGSEALELVAVTPDPASQVIVLTEMAWAVMELGRYDEALSLAEHGEQLASRLGLRRGLARAKNNQGVIHRRLGRFTEALSGFQGSMDVYEELGDRAGVATSLNNQSVVLGWDLGDHARALETQLQALAIRQELGDEAALYQSYNTLGVLYGNVGRRGQALRYLEQALDGWRQLQNRPRIAATLTNLATIHNGLGEYERALDLQLEALSLREAVGSDPGTGYSLESLGETLTGMGRLDEARLRLEEALRIREGLGERKNTASSLLALARLDLLSGDPTVGEERAVRALAIAEEISAQDLQREAHQALSLIREERGDYQGALDSYRQFKALEAVLFSQERALRIEALRAQDEADRVQRQMEALRTEARLASAMAERRGFQGLVVVLVLLVAFLLYRRRVMALARTRLAREVEERTAELSAVNQRLEVLSLTDQLTGLPNRRFALQRLESDLALATRARRDASDAGSTAESSDIIFYLLDVDDFKSVNDDHGHAAGDEVLRQMARLLEETSRASDVVIRWGGEEFLIISRQVDRSGAAAFANRLRNAIRNHVFEVSEGVTLQKTCSVGFAAFPFIIEAPEAVPWDRVAGLADLASYVAKRSGRDAWVGLLGTPALMPETITPDGDVVRRLVEKKLIQVRSSLVEEGRALVWDRPGAGPGLAVAR